MSLSNPISYRNIFEILKHELKISEENLKKIREGFEEGHEAFLITSDRLIFLVENNIESKLKERWDTFISMIFAVSKHKISKPWYYINFRPITIEKYSQDCDLIEDITIKLKTTCLS